MHLIACKMKQQSSDAFNPIMLPVWLLFFMFSPVLGSKKPQLLDFENKMFIKSIELLTINRQEDEKRTADRAAAAQDYLQLDKINRDGSMISSAFSSQAWQRELEQDSLALLKSGNNGGASIGDSSRITTHEDQGSKHIAGLQQQSPQSRFLGATSLSTRARPPKPPKSGKPPDAVYTEGAAFWLPNAEFDYPFVCKCQRVRYERKSSSLSTSGPVTGVVMCADDNNDVSDDDSPDDKQTERYFGSCDPRLGGSSKSFSAVGCLIAAIISLLIY